MNNPQRTSSMTDIDSSDVKRIIDANSSQIAREIATALNTFHMSLENHLRKLCYAPRLNV